MLLYLAVWLCYFSNFLIAFLDSFWWSKKHSAEPSPCTEDEKVPMPVQEVCGHKEWQGEV